MSRRHLIKSTGIIGSATALSRVLGFIRDIVIARLFGTAVYAQAFVVAFRIPNLLRDLIGEGAANSAIVPVLTGELTTRGREEFFRLAQVVLNIVVVALATITLIGILMSPVIVRLIAPGFIADPEKLQITITLTRIIFPFLMMVGLWAYAMGVLNSLGYFASPALGPVMLNLSMIVCATWFGENVLGLAAGVLAGGMLQILIQLPPLYRSGWKARLTAEFTHPKARKIGGLLIPRTLGACVYQVDVFISTILASFLSVKGDEVAALYYANRVWQLPLAIFAIPLAQAALPAMSRHAALNDIAEIKNTVYFSIKTLLCVLVPSTVGLMVLHIPITGVLFERGAFTSYSTAITANALMFYAMGLVACGGAKVLANAFYSLHDTRTPVKAAFVALATNITMSLMLMWPLKAGGLALANSIATTVNFIMLYILLKKRVKDLSLRPLAELLTKVTVASLAMGACLFISMHYIPYKSAWGLFLEMAIGMAVFFAVSHALGIKELRELLGWISGRR